MAKFITTDTLSYFKSRLDATFVAREKKTGSDTDYKVLSDNNLTDELVQRINEASGNIEKATSADIDALFT